MTKDINHHLNNALLMAYSAGNLPEAFSLIVASHVSMCDECRARLGAFDAIGGSVMDACETVSLREDCFEATMSRIDDANTEPAMPVTPSTDGILPQPIRDYVGGDLDAVKWRPVGLGVKQAILPTDAEGTARLLYIPAGAAVPDHGHRGTELTLVLKGAFSDEVDRFAAGDVEIADEELDHTPVADVGEDCICLAATDAPLKFRSWLPRIAQPFLRI
ncbi:ChrR family anti-sigma-E factor [Roseovarius aestuariivivens]|uniref:ChrR family anti-sigma-E factor n=1 Tax=Roseovarius aestuariivivens TaxID=1888910 RepID=UPI001080915D|nr:ChrR family anti-sigma-E factor [Roseovarius aestuariivivens]